MGLPRLLNLPWSPSSQADEGLDAEVAALRQAAWVARCVGRGSSAPLSSSDVTAIASELTLREFEPGQLLFSADVPGDTPGDVVPDGADPGVWIVRAGRIELVAGDSQRRSVVNVLHPGDVDGDVQLLLGMPFPYEGRAVEDVTALHLDGQAFERLLMQHPAIARRWLSSVAQRLVMSQNRIIGLLGRSLASQVAQLLIDESADGEVPLPQRTLAAMIGVQRPSLNKVLKELERRGLISVGYGVIGLKDREQLEGVAG